MHCELARAPTLRKAELPAQKSLAPLYQVLGHDKARLLQRGKHVRKHLANARQPTHIVEGVLEVCLAGP